MGTPRKSMYLTGIDTVMKNLNRADSRIAAAIEEGLKEAGQRLLDESKTLVPVDTGRLRDSAWTGNVGGQGVDADVVVSYGNDKVDYAVWVHEDLDKAHGEAFNIGHAQEIEQGVTHPRRPQETAKFLERPMRTERKRLLQIVADRVRRVVK